VDRLASGVARKVLDVKGTGCKDVLLFVIPSDGSMQSTHNFVVRHEVIVKKNEINYMG